MSASTKTRSDRENGNRSKGGTRTERLGVRLPAHVKERIEVAAAYQGVSVSEFVLATASEEATRTIERHTRFHLDAEASRRFKEALDRPARPVEELVNLFRS